VDGASLAAEFERHRGHLTGIAYRMLGTVADAEDAVQETYLRYSRADGAGMRDARAWLTTTIARVCLDEMGSARARRESYIGPGYRNRWSAPTRASVRTDCTGPAARAAAAPAKRPAGHPDGIADSG
jgi:DNA-directed RNA polymerase specialized sigma24 family protein